MKNDHGPYFFNSKYIKFVFDSTINIDIYLFKILRNNVNQSTINIDFKLE